MSAVATRYERRLGHGPSRARRPGERAVADRSEFPSAMSHCARTAEVVATAHASIEA